MFKLGAFLRNVALDKTVLSSTQFEMVEIKNEEMKVASI